MSKVIFKNLDQKTKGSYYISIGYGQVLTDGDLKPVKMTATQYNKHVKTIIKRERSRGLQNFRSEVTARLNDRNLWIFSHCVTTKCN